MNRLLIISFAFAVLTGFTSSLNYRKVNSTGYNLLLKWGMVKMSKNKITDEKYSIKMTISIQPDYENFPIESKRCDSILESSYSYLAFNNEKNIYLLNELNDTIYSAGYIYEGDYGMHREYKMVTMFNLKAEQIKNKFKLIYNDQLITNKSISQEL